MPAHSFLDRFAPLRRGADDREGTSPSLRAGWSRFALRRGALLLVAGSFAMLGPSCSSYDPSLGPTPFRCASSPPLCPQNYACVNGLCTLHGMTRMDAYVYYDSGRFPPDGAKCPDADLEPNDTPKTATMLLHQNITLDNLAICPAGDVDYYSIFLKAGATLTVDVLDNPARGEIDLQVLDTDAMKLLGSASGPNADQHVSVTVTNDGYYFILVEGATTTVANGYSLSVQLS